MNTKTDDFFVQILLRQSIQNNMYYTYLSISTSDSFYPLGLKLLLFFLNLSYMYSSLISITLLRLFIWMHQYGPKHDDKSGL